jgi:hypothetical protein
MIRMTSDHAGIAPFERAKRSLDYLLRSKSSGETELIHETESQTLIM